MSTISSLVRDGVRVCLLAACLLTVATVSARQPDAPGLNDLVIYEPGAHERGLPAVQFRSADRGPGLCVDIPPTVHVHRYYYSGDKEIQGPIMQGGPTVVVASHPKTGERMYVDVMLPAGAPRISYCKSSITYVFPERRVVVHFSRYPFSSDRVIVKYYQGQGIGRKMEAFHGKAKSHVKQHMAKSSSAQSVKQAAADTGKLLVGVKEAVGTLGSKAIDGAKSAVDLIPGVVPLRSMAEDRPKREYEDTVRQAARRKELDATRFVPTNR